VFYPHKTKPPMGEQSHPWQSSETPASLPKQTDSVSGTQPAAGSADNNGANSGNVSKPVKHTDNHPRNIGKTPEDQQPVESYDGMTRSDIPHLLQMARMHYGNGDYDNANREYRDVLHLDPSNAEAKEGLRRLGLQNTNR
jgi:TolA-binding protein